MTIDGVPQILLQSGTGSPSEERYNPTVPLKLKIGDTFPSLSLTSDRGQSISIAKIADGRPLMLTFYRGPW